MAGKRKKPKNPGGRPKVDERLRLSRRLDDVRFSEADLERLKNEAAKSGLRWSDFVRGKLGLACPTAPRSG